jgi:hypothetical protein
LRLYGTRNWAATKRPEFSTYHKQHYNVILKTGRKAQMKQSTILDRKQVLPCEAENYLAEHCLLMERKFFGLTVADVMRLA